MILSNSNDGFAGGNNRVIRKVYDAYKYVLLLNNDTVVTSDFIEKMISLLDAKPSVGYASCRIDNYFDRDMLWNCGGVLRLWGTRRYYSEKELGRMPEVISAEFITGCALFLRKETIDRYGTLSEDFFHGEEDFNFSWRMKRNHVKGCCLNQTLVYHKISASSKDEGIQLGKVAGYYACRIIDMKQFYHSAIWHVWKAILLQALKIRWLTKGYSLADITKMIDIINRSSHLDKLNREDTLKIWSLEF